MFFDPRIDPRPAPLLHNPLNALVGPRPIGWITTLDAAGVPNLAPYSYFNAFSADPPIVGFAPNARDGAGTPKDTLANLRVIPEFTASVVSMPQAEAMNRTSRALPPGVSEYTDAGLHPAPSERVRPPRVREARAALECVVFDIVALPARALGRGSHLVLAEVVGIHIDDTLIRDGRVDALELAQVGRLGYFDYATVSATFEMRRPD
ncbi:MAG: flavin reductase family protein [Pseudomonadales bacterium]|nr:flavin reductase family protein [Pseudomonadales bacterium]